MTEQDNKIPVANVDQQGKVQVFTPNTASFASQREKVQAKFVNGFYQNIRNMVMYTLFVLFFITPWLRWNGHQALLFSTVDGNIYFFGISLLPQDYFYLVMFVLVAIFLLFAVTTFAGRVFCGYSCPQTIWVNLFMRIERLCEGERHKRIRLDKASFSWNKATRRGIKHTLWWLVSIATGLTFVSYFVPTDSLLANVQTITMLGLTIPYFAVSGTVLFFIALFSLATYANAGWMREQVCFHICPYGRLQSTMMDKDTLIVSYDVQRGEPRTAGKKKKDTEQTAGDCIDCYMCVQVCPTGIDIRDGLQMECIQCAACIDACNEIMDKVGKPKGLVGYTTERQLVDNKPTKVLRLRLFMYTGLIAVIVAAIGYNLSNRLPMQIDCAKDRNQMYRLQNNTVENSYMLKLTNKSQDVQTYTVKLVNAPTYLRLEARQSSVVLQPGETYKMPVSITSPLEPLVKQGSGETDIEFELARIDDTQQKVVVSDVFRSPTDADLNKLARDNAL